MPVYNFGDVISSFGSPSTGGTGLDVDGSGTLWYSDAVADAIYNLTRSGSVISSFSTPLNDPWGLGVDPSGFVWHTDRTGPVYKTTQSGSVVSSFLSPSAVDPEGIDVGPSGFVWLAGDVGVGGTPDKIYKTTQSGSVVSSFQTPGSIVRGVGVDASGFVWQSNADGDKIYKTTRSGSVISSFGGQNPRGLGVDPSGFIWAIEDIDDSVLQYNGETPRGIAPATNPTAAATPPAVGTSTTTSATATPPTAAVSSPTAHADFTTVATASKPTTTATATSPTGVAGVTGAATKPTTSASPRDPLAYADKPLLDGEPIDSDVRQTTRHDGIELELRADDTTVRDVLRAAQQDVGKLNRLDFPDGGFEHADPTGGANTFRYTPRYAEFPFLTAQDVLVDAYTERTTARDASAARVVLGLRLASNVAPDTGLISEAAGAKDWLFETYAGAIATERVRVDTEAQADMGAPGFVLRLFLDATQARALRAATGHLGSAGTAGTERGDVDAVDNSPNKSNSLNLQPRDTSLVDRGHYVVRDVEFERLDPEGTWYATRVVLLPNTDPVVEADAATVSVTPTEGSLTDSAVIFVDAVRPTATASGAEAFASFLVEDGETATFTSALIVRGTVENQGKIITKAP